MYTQLLQLAAHVLKDEPLSQHTTFKIGGPCDYMVFVQSAQEAAAIAAFAREHHIRFTVLGNGSNVLVADEGLDGIVLNTTRMNSIHVENDKIVAGCGATLSAVCYTAIQNSLDGMCELSGIPGTVGGAVYMNAGAYGSEIRQVLSQTVYLDEEGNVRTLEGEFHQFSYRHSIFFHHPEWVILKAAFVLRKGNQAELKEKNVEFLRKRNEKQPLDFPNAGSTFKRPIGHFAGKLIEDCHLRGFAVGDAQVSEKHCGFVINRGNATAREVKTLIAHVKDTVLQTYGVELEPEIKYFERGNPTATL